MLVLGSVIISTKGWIEPAAKPGNHWAVPLRHDTATKRAIRHGAVLAVRKVGCVVGRSKELTERKGQFPSCVGSHM